MIRSIASINSIPYFQIYSATHFSTRHAKKLLFLRSVVISNRFSSLFCKSFRSLPIISISSLDKACTSILSFSFGAFIIPMVFHQVLRFNLIFISALSIEIYFFWFYISNLYQFLTIEANSHFATVNIRSVITNGNFSPFVVIIVCLGYSLPR